MHKLIRTKNELGCSGRFAVCLIFAPLSVTPVAIFLRTVLWGCCWQNGMVFLPKVIDDIFSYCMRG